MRRKTRARDSNQAPSPQRWTKLKPVRDTLAVVDLGCGLPTADADAVPVPVADADEVEFAVGQALDPDAVGAGVAEATVA